MGAREVSNRGGNTIGYFPSITMKQQIPYESTIERDKITLEDFKAEVRAIIAQPLVIPYQYHNKTVTYTPDLLVQTVSKCILIECKPAELVETEDNQRKFDEARKWCEQHRFEFEVVTDEQIRAGFRLKNVKRLTQYARHTISPQMKSRTYGILQAAPKPLSIEELAIQIAPHNFGSALSCILHLAYYHQIDMDLDKEKISNSSLVWLPSRLATKE